jgi:hypothetical protein
MNLMNPNQPSAGRSLAARVLLLLANRLLLLLPVVTRHDAKGDSVVPLSAEAQH